MKTTVEISDALLDQAKLVAAKEQTTLRELIEDGLRRVLAERKRAKPFRLKDGSYRGKGLVAELRGASWEAIRDRIYEGRGA